MLRIGNSSKNELKINTEIKRTPTNSNNISSYLFVVFLKEICSNSKNPNNQKKMRL